MRKAKVVARTKARWRSFARLVNELRWRLSPDPTKPITQERFARFLGVSGSTVARWETGSGQADPHSVGKLHRLVRALDALGEMVVREARLLFFEQRHPLLARCRPIDLLATEEGFVAVMDQVEGGASGSFA